MLAKCLGGGAEKTAECLRSSAQPTSRPRQEREPQVHHEPRQRRDTAGGARQRQRSFRGSASSPLVLVQELLRSFKCRLGNDERIGDRQVGPLSAGRRDGMSRISQEQG